MRVRRKEEGKERKEERIEEHVSFNFVCPLFFLSTVSKLPLIRKEDV